MRRSSSSYLMVLVGSVILVIISVGVGAYWSAGQDAKTNIPIWDLVLKAVAAFLTLIGATIAVFRYLDDRARAIDASVLEARKPFLMKRQEVYTDLVQTTAVISTIENYEAPASEKAERKFWITFWGSLPMVTDETVSALADEFSEILADRRPDWIPLRNLSMNLSRACRASMGFDPPLPPPSPVTLQGNARPGA